MITRWTAQPNPFNNPASRSRYGIAISGSGGPLFRTDDWVCQMWSIQRLSVAFASWPIQMNYCSMWDPWKTNKHVHMVDWMLWLLLLFGQIISLFHPLGSGPRTICLACQFAVSAIMKLHLPRNKSAIPNIPTTATYRPTSDKWIPFYSNTICGQCLCRSARRWLS